MNLYVYGVARFWNDSGGAESLKEEGMLPFCSSPLFGGLLNFDHQLFKLCFVGGDAASPCAGAGAGAGWGPL